MHAYRVDLSAKWGPQRQYAIPGQFVFPPQCVFISLAFFANCSKPYWPWNGSPASARPASSWKSIRALERSLCCLYRHTQYQSLNWGALPCLRAIGLSPNPRGTDKWCRTSVSSSTVSLKTTTACQSCRKPAINRPAEKLISSEKYLS